MNKKGFTLIEIIVVIFIIGTISSITISQYSQYRNSKSLSLAEKQIVDDIKMVQNYAYNILKNNGSFSAGGYGIHFSKNSNVYTIFVDNGDMEYDSSNENFKEIELPESVEIVSLKINNIEKFDGTVDLVFASPYGKVSIDKENKIGENFINLEIEISNSNDSKNIIISSSRLIN